MILLGGLMGIRNLARAGVLSGIGLIGILGGCEDKGEVTEVAGRDDRISASSYFSDSEFEIINYTAECVGVDSAYLMAIRKAENGRDGLEFGIISTSEYGRDIGIVENGEFRGYKNEFEKQASWCAWTVKKNLERFRNSNFDGDFIEFLQVKYCPVGVENDPDGLNKNWAKNVRFYYDKFKGD